jgi:hypothetical protein
MNYHNALPDPDEREFLRLIAGVAGRMADKNKAPRGATRDALPETRGATRETKTNTTPRSGNVTGGHNDNTV